MKKFLVALLCAGTMAASAQQPPPQIPTFRAGVDIVYVDVSVLDGHRKPVRGLSAADFTVKEDGKVRPVVAFSPVTLPPREPAKTAWADQTAPDVVTNEHVREGRLVIILMDQSIPSGLGTTKAR